MRIVFNNILAIYRKELQGYFASPLAYVIAGVFWLLAGLFFVFILQYVVQQSSSQDLQGQQMGMPPQPMDVPYLVLQSFLSVMGSLSQVILPILAMGLYAEERKRGTLELLATSPITNWAVATGKWLGVMTYFISLVLPVMAYEAFALSSAKPPFSPWIFLAAHAGLILLAGSILSLGLFISSLTDSSILAAMLTFGLILVLWIMDLIGQNLGGPLGSALSHLSLLQHYSQFTQGAVDSSSLVLFASYIFLGIFLTAQSIEAFKFQRS
jgi:ABC-2 type transport system permease protein